MPDVRRRARRVVHPLVSTVTVSIAMALALTGCTGAPAPVHPTATTPSATASPTPPPTPSPNPTQAIAFPALRVGDCLDTPAGSDEAEDISFTVVPCSGAHISEVFGLPVAGSGGYPGDGGVIAAGEDACGGLFTSYVGVSVYSTDSLDYSVYTPSESDWNAGHRQAACVIFSPDGRLVGSVRGIGSGSPRTTP